MLPDVPGASGPTASAHPDLPYTPITVNDDTTFEQCHARSGMRTFPQVFIDGQVIGYDELSGLHASGELAQLR